LADKGLADRRGVSDENGKSPFWQWVEEHFFSMDFPTADYLTGIGQKVFIAELMPKYPIYVNLLSKDAQAVIGQVHDKTRPAIKLLKDEGFTFNGYVDIFDAGPTVEADISNIKTIRDCQNRKVVIGEMNSDAGQTYMLSNHKLVDFRASLSTMTLDASSDTVTLSTELANALHVSEGDVITVAPL
jgi:arginine N-succinyltransferase